MVKFGNKIKYLREKRGLSQTDLAKVLKITNSMVSAYESNSRNPSYDVLIKLSSFFNIFMDYLFGNVEERNLSLDNLTERQIKEIDTVVTSLKTANIEMRRLKAMSLSVSKQSKARKEQIKDEK